MWKRNIYCKSLLFVSKNNFNNIIHDNNKELINNKVINNINKNQGLLMKNKNINAKYQYYQDKAVSFIEKCELGYLKILQNSLLLK